MLSPLRSASLVAVVSAVLVTARPAGQTIVMQGPPAPATAERPAPPVPPDRKAFTDIQKITDNDQKLAALDKWLEDFPESTSKTQTLNLIFDTLIKHRPTDRRAILDAAQRVFDNAADGARAASYSRVANALLAAGIFYEDAAGIAEKGLGVFEDEENKRVMMARASHLATLGRIRWKQGRVADAEKTLKAAYEANPETPTALIGLAEISERADAKAALGYWMQAALTGRLSKEDRGSFESFYRKSNNGTLDGLEAALDAKYKATFTAPIHPTEYKPTKARTDKVVLAEVFTGAGCPPCVAADLAFDAAMERYPRRDLAVVMYHMHIPLPDPLTNKATIERAKYYNVNGVPTAAIDGLTSSGGGARNFTKAAFERIRPTIDTALEAPSGAQLRVEATIADGIVKVKATPSGIGADGEAVKLQILLVEEMLSYSGENGVRFHPMVVRNIGGANYAGFTVDRKSPAAVEHAFDLAQTTKETEEYIDNFEKTRSTTTPGFAFSRKPIAMNATNLSVVAFLQEEKTKKLLQTSYVRLSPPANTAGR